MNFPDFPVPPKPSDLWSPVWCFSDWVYGGISTSSPHCHGGSKMLNITHGKVKETMQYWWMMSLENVQHAIGHEVHLIKTWARNQLLPWVRVCELWRVIMSQWLTHTHTLKWSYPWVTYLCLPPTGWPPSELRCLTEHVCVFVCVYLSHLQ